MKEEQNFEYREEEKKMSRRRFILSLIGYLTFEGLIIAGCYYSVLSKIPRFKKDDERWMNNTLIYYFVKGGYDPGLFKEFYQKYTDLVEYSVRNKDQNILIASFELYERNPPTFEKIYNLVMKDPRIDSEYKPLIISKTSQLCLRIGCEKENLTDSSIKALINLATEYESSK